MSDMGPSRRFAPGDRDRRHALRGRGRGCADRLADALVQGLAAPLHRPRVEAVLNGELIDRLARRAICSSACSSATWPWTSRASASSRSRGSRSITASSHFISQGHRARSDQAASAGNLKIEQGPRRLESRAAGQGTAEGSRARRPRRARVDAARSKSPTPTCRSAMPVGTSGSHCREQLSDVDIKAGFEYEPVQLFDRPRASELQRDGAGVRAGAGAAERSRFATTTSISTGSRSTPRESSLHDRRRRSNSTSRRRWSR